MQSLSSRLRLSLVSFSTRSPRLPCKGIVRCVSSYTLKDAPSLSPRTSVHHTAQPSFQVCKVTYFGGVGTSQLKISQLLQEASILPRDLFTLNLTSRQERRLRPAVRRTPAAIVPRSIDNNSSSNGSNTNHTIIVSFGKIRAVVGLDGVHLLDAHQHFVMEFAQLLAREFQQARIHGEPPELVFLEQVLKETMDSFARRLRLYEPILDSFLDKVTNEVYSDTGVHQLVPLKDSLQSFELHVKQCLDCLTALLNDDEQMLDLLVTEQAAAEKSGRSVSFSRHEHVELLLGVYARELSNIGQEISLSLGRLQSKQEFVALALAGYRNRMIRMNVHIGIAGLTLGLGTTVAGFFGMNLINGMEDSAVAFNYVVGGSGLAGLVVAMSSLNYLSGSAMQRRATQRQKENELLTNALADLGAVDYALKSTLMNNNTSGTSQTEEEPVVLDRKRFRKVLQQAKPSKYVSEEEVDLLFQVLDRVKDGNLTTEDFYSTNNNGGHGTTVQRDQDSQETRVTKEP